MNGPVRAIMPGSDYSAQLQDLLSFLKKGDTHAFRLLSGSASASEAALPSSASSSTTGLLAAAASTTSGSTCAAGHHQNIHAHEAVLFPFIAMFIGCLVTWGSSRSPFLHLLPYTVWLFVIGIGLGWMDWQSSNGLGNLSESIKMWTHIDPHVLLYTFLPVLLFGDSMNINWVNFRRCAAQCSILAGPGVLIGTGLMYIVAKFCFPYDWTPYECAAFGSILAATDPVAVVGLLNEMGASQTLTMQIAGESLLNDGMAIVVWSLFDNLMLGEEYTVGDIIGQFVRLAVGGVIFGALVGFITLRGLAMASDKLIHTDHLVQLALTFTAAYLSFFLGENELKVSGVLSTIFAALVVGKDSWPLMCSEEAMRHVWHTSEFFANTVLFMLCGMVFFESTLNVRAEDWGWLFFLYMSAVGARAIMMFSAFPFLNLVAASKAAKVSWRECLVMTWGGLRGAVGLALALVMRSQLYSCGKFHTGDLIVFFVGGFAGLTLLINASTCGALLRGLHLTKPPSSRKKLLDSLQEELFEIAKNLAVDLVAGDRRFLACKLSDIEQVLHHQVTVAQSSAAAPKASDVPVAKKSLATDDRQLMEQEPPVMGVHTRSPSYVGPKRKSTDDSPQATPSNGEGKRVQISDEESAVEKEEAFDAELHRVAQTNPAASWRVSTTVPGAESSAAIGQNTENSVGSFRPKRVSIDAVEEAKARASHKTAKQKKESVAMQQHWWWGFEPIKYEEIELEVANVVTGKDRESHHAHAIPASDMQAERLFYLSMLRAQYAKQLREDLIPQYAQGAVDLPQSIDRSTDHAYRVLKDWVQLRKLMFTHLLGISSWIAIAIDLITGGSPYSMYSPAETADGAYCFDLFSVVVFLDAHHLVCSRLTTEKSLSIDCAVSRLARSLVIAEAGREVEDAHIFLKENKVGAELIGIVRTKQLLAVLFAKQRKQVEKWRGNGIINIGEAEELIHPVHHSMKQVRYMGRSEGGDLIMRGKTQVGSVTKGLISKLGKASKDKLLDTE